MLLLPCSAILCGVVVWKKLDAKSNFVKLLLAWLALLLAFAAVRIAMTYALTGKLELSFTGPVYAGFVADSSRIGDTLARLPGYISQLRGHASFVLLTYFTPLMILTFFAMRRFMPGENQRPLAPQFSALLLFAIVIFAFIVAMTIKFSVDIVAADTNQTITRLQGRYYSFAFPFIPICAAVVLDRYCSDLRLPQPRVWVFVIAGFLALLALFVGARLGRFEGSFGVVDFPDTFFMRQRGARFCVLAVAVLVTVLLLKRGRHGATWFIAYWAILMSFPTIAAQHWAVTAVRETNEDRFPIAVKHLIGPDEKNAGLIVASTYDDGKVFRVMFYLNSLSHAIIVPKGSALGEGRIDPDREWLLLLDDYRVLVPAQTIVKGDGFELVRLLKSR